MYTTLIYITFFFLVFSKLIVLYNDTSPEFKISTGETEKNMYHAQYYTKSTYH